ncbi:MAG TPA: TonB-dependent receptor [Polyangia bacterium]|nr:TonB-dependent receptor [Polyangia bacterium]
MRKTIVALAIIALVPAAARAQTATGRVDGLVVDSGGMPLARVVVTATSKTQIGGKRVTQTNDSGEFHLIGLTPGNFKLRFEATGLKEETREIHVGVNETVSLDVLMEVAGKEEVHVITAERPVVEVRKSGSGENYDAEFLKNMPLQNRSYQSVMGLTAGVSGSGNPNVRGGAFFNNSYAVDGMDTTDAVTHTFGTNFNFDAISEVQVQTAGLGAENSMTTGGTVNVVTKSGSNQFQLDSSVYYADDRLVLKGSGEEQSTFSDVQANVNVGGPILKDKLWYYGSVQYDRHIRTLPPDPNGVLPRHPSRDFNGVEYLLKLTYSLNPRNKFTFSTQGAPASIDNISQVITVEPEAEQHQDQFTQIYTLAWESPIRDDLFLKLTAGYQREALDNFPQSCNSADPMVRATCQTTASVSDSTLGTTTQNGSSIYHDVRNMLRLSGDASYFPQRKLAGDHELKTGFRFTYASNPSLTGVAGGTVLQNQNGQPFQRTLYCQSFDPLRGVDLDPMNPDLSRCTQGLLSLEVSGQFGSYFLQDTWSPTRYLHITPGAAIDFGRTANYQDHEITKFVTWTPHVNATWDATHDGKTAVRAGFNQYVDSGMLAISSFVGRDQFTRTCNWNPDTMQYDLGCRNGGGLAGVSVAQPYGRDKDGNPLNADGSIVCDKSDPRWPDCPVSDLSPPRTTEVLVGMDREIWTQFSLGGEFIYRQFDHLFEDIETNLIWDAKGADLATVGPQYKNGKAEFRFDLETPDAARRRYYGFTVNARKVLGRLHMLGSWTISKTEGTENSSFATVFLDNATQSHFYYGPLPDDHRHAIKVQVSYDVTDSFLVGAQYVYVTGAPYNEFFLNNFYGGYYDFRAPRGMIPTNPNDPSTFKEGRLPDFTQLDLHASYSVKKYTGQNLMAVLDIFNLLNTRTPITFEERALPMGAVKFGDVTNRQIPLQVRVGLRYVY